MVQNVKIGIVGLGYVGLPLAVEFAKKYSVVGFDIDENRVNELNNYTDRTLEISNEILVEVIKLKQNEVDKGLFISNNLSSLNSCNVYIVTVPTPIDKYNRPVLKPLFNATTAIGSILKEGDIVIYESTVYPGVTEEECVPILEKESGLKFNIDFFAGYSPERINPGDKEHTVSKILKVTSGSTPEIANIIDALYKSIITAGTYKAPTIKVAEAAKVIENAQRDINIAFVNELAKIFDLLHIDTHEVLNAASTKWNFLKFKPGLVGGHCIGVDPYYLAQKAQEVGYHPEIILAGRRTNDSMGKFVALQTIKCMMQKDIKIIESSILILGITFKENCPDVRNTRVVDIYQELNSFGIRVDIFDPWANSAEVFEEYKIQLLSSDVLPSLSEYSAIILAVAHDKFLELEIKKSYKQVVFDVKGILPVSNIDARL